ncbi:aminotransferase class I/II-fold pyridoxal phosphate-dependent enzyme [Streptomyces sp. NRAIS4]
MNDIAIVGIGCRFPGARDSQAYWKLLLGAERQFAPVPEDRWNHATFHEPGDRGAPDAAYTDQVAFLDAVDRFDAVHYALPPRRVEAMDPQHRLMLDATREALDDAGLGRGGFDRETTGVFFGLSVSDHKERMTARLRALCLADGSLGAPADPGLLRALKGRALEHLGPVEAFTLPGSLLNMAPATVSRHFGLGGPSLAVDAACSSSLVALDQAVLHLRQGTCGTAVVGGVYLSLTPDSLVGFARLGALSADGVCRPFDQRADGFVLGEGAGAVVVRPLRDALAHGDRVYAVIKGIGSANDGTAPGPLCPTPEGQLWAMRRAYADAGVPPSAVGFIEAHGTGTSVGDRVEVEALRRLRTGHPDGQPDGNRPCYLSSGKALIGHALSAAGIAGLIRTALVVHHRTVVPQPDTDPHPGLGLDAAGLRIAATARPWPDGDTPRCAAVSSFGFGGTNVHVVLQEAPAPAPGRRPQPTRPEPEPQLALISAGGPERLREHIDELLQALEHAPTPSMAALAHTLGGRAPLRSRLAIVAADPAEFTERLRRARRRLADGAWGDLGDGAFAAEAPRPAVREEDRRLLDLPVARLDTRSYWLRRPDPGSGLRALQTPTDPTAPIHDLTKEFPMRELLDLMGQQVAVLSRLSETLPAVPTAPPRATPGSADGSSPPGTGPDTGIENAVLGQIARTSAFPVDRLRSDQLLVEDLGFDSLMLTDLFTSLKGRWPAPRIDERCARPTVAGGTAMITDSTGTAEPLLSPDATDRTDVGGRELISFSGYNYLGLAAHPTVHEAVKEAVDRYGTSASASRLLSGTRPLHQDLESELARTPITMTSGHATNVTVIGHLVGPGDLIVHDALAHDSILQGCKLSGATRRPFPHNDAAALDTLLTRIRHQYRRVLVVAEGGYSMDGDIADLPALVAVKRRHGALLMVDEAHSIGVLGAGGRGVGEHFGVERADVDLWMGTLSKSLAGCGGYVAADRAVVDYLRYTAPGFVYSAGMTPADAAASLAALRLMRAEPERLARLGENAALFVRLARRAGVDTGSSEGTPIVPCVVGDSAKTLRLARALFEQGVSVDPILHPAVLEELARLRFFLTCEHTPEQIRYTVAALERQLRAVGGADIAPAA